MVNFKGFGKKRSWFTPDTIPAFPCLDWGKSRKTSVRIAGIPVEIRTEHLPNTSLEIYLQINLFYVMPCSMVDIYTHFRGTCCIFCPKDGGRKYLRNVGKYQPDYTAQKTPIFIVTA
jgi:hypothetical protein